MNGYSEIDISKLMSSSSHDAKAVHYGQLSDRPKQTLKSNFQTSRSPKPLQVVFILLSLIHLPVISRHIVWYAQSMLATVAL